MIMWKRCRDRVEYFLYFFNLFFLVNIEMKGRGDLDEGFLSAGHSEDEMRESGKSGSAAGKIKKQKL